MLVRRFVDDRLAQVSYLIGCQRTGEAIVIDPPRLIAPLLLAAKEEGLSITRVTETHIHADFLSGAREIVAATGAEALLSAEGGDHWQYAWGRDGGATLLHHGDVITMGGVRITVRHTPGHTPEHLSFLVTDTARSETPVGLISGDFLFVGDVGRPDLLERAAHVADSMTASARQLFGSIQALRDLPDHLQIWPGHGAGSACGKALGAMPSSTLGYERLSNWAFAIDDEAAFVAAVLEGQPTPPAYFAQMKMMNRAGAPLLDLTAPALLTPDRLTAALRDTTVIDVRPGKAFAAAHVAGTLSLPLIKAFPTWAGWFVPYDRPISLIAEDITSVTTAREMLASIGLDRVAGYFGPDVLTSAAAEGLIRTAALADVLEAPALLESGRLVIDIRAPSEWEAGHIPGATHHLLGTIPESLADMDRSTPIAVHCQGGTRSGIGAAVLERMGFRDVIDLQGGYGRWEKEKRKK